jgi:hypothetical protein
MSRAADIKPRNAPQTVYLIAVKPLSIVPSLSQTSELISPSVDGRPEMGRRDWKKPDEHDGYEIKNENRAV